MRIQRAAPANELLAKILFLIIPTAVVGYFLLRGLVDFYSLPIDNSLQWAVVFGIGMVGSALFHGLRFRALLPLAGLVAVLWIIYKGLDRLPLGEFDQIKVESNFYVMSTLLVLGWIAGWGFVRIRYWSILIAAYLLIACIAVIAKHHVDTVEHLEKAFAPALIYAVYIIFTAEQIYGYGDKEQKFWWFLSRRLIGFAAVTALLLWGVFRYYDKEIKETVATYGTGGKEGKNSMLRQDSSGNFDLKRYSQLRSQLGRSNELLFCARIDNFFPHTDLPNPLYLTAFYYNKFDTGTETFEPDTTAIPRNDLFQPDPSRITLFGQKYDSSVIKNSGTNKGGRTVEVQVYARKLSAGTYLAPHTGYFVQPITVEKDFRDSFKYAFRAKSYVSDLNSAYFIYNVKNPQIQAFQEMRFNILRKAPAYGSEPADFMRYYTYMPGDAKFARISQLAHEITAKAQTPVDKVLAIRDWFLSKRPDGQPLFKYTDNPGIPDIPNASKLMYFLFENRKGYCAYYAGATLFMLRSLGIPSRIAVGFLTVDRSGGKNKGWYWYYADQAHAWVQVYFPEYGWLDFDTTVGNDEARESPQTDGTPPMQPPVAYLAADGVVTGVDTVRRTIAYKVHHFILHDKEYRLTPEDAVLDVHVAAIRRDSVDVPLSVVKPGDSVTAVSYADAFKNMQARAGEDAKPLLARFPKPEPVDEVYLKRRPEERRKEEPPAVAKEAAPFNWERAGLIAGLIAGLLLALFFALPAIVLAYFNGRSRRAATGESRAYWTYRAATFYLHQLGYLRGSLTPMQYARDTIDPVLGTAFGAFMNSYLKVKYAKQPLNATESQQVGSFLPRFYAQVQGRIPAKRRLGAFLRPLRAIAFFVRPGTEEAA